jgi:hypothetical protein
MGTKHLALSLDLIKEHLEGSNIQVIEFLDNSKASEFYIRTKFIQDDGFEWTSIVPYEYRRSGLKLETEQEVAKYLKSVKPFFTKKWMEEWKNKEESNCKNEIVEKEKKNAEKIARGKKTTAIVTPYFFLPLLSFKEVNGSELPENRNPQRRLSTLKEAGYTIAIVQYGNERTTSTLLPFPKYQEMGYETFTPQFKARVIRLLKGINAFEAKETNRKSLIPDHKFSEVRWDESTKAENPINMTDQEIIQKFQLLDNQRNQQKREVCRHCFQTKERGTIYGINYFYKGTKKWDKSIPDKGKAAEKGCEGCPWYDIEKWRTMLNKKLKK